MKKWFMLQVWRLQQVAQILTLVLLALNLALQMYSYVSWRTFLFSNPYTGVPFLVLILACAIWGFAIYWDLGLKMWRDQQVVLTEKNPYAKERMSAKEIAMYRIIWLPLLEGLAKDDPRTAESAGYLRRWIAKAEGDDPNLRTDIDDIMRHLGVK
jgi:hypothetical protein